MLLAVAEDRATLRSDLSADVLCSLFGLRSHADGEESQVAESNALAVEDKLLQAVEHIHHHAVHSAAAIRRVVG